MSFWCIVGRLAISLSYSSAVFCSPLIMFFMSISEWLVMLNIAILTIYVCVCVWVFQKDFYAILKKHKIKKDQSTYVLEVLPCAHSHEGSLLPCSPLLSMQFTEGSLEMTQALVFKIKLVLPNPRPWIYLNCRNTFGAPVHQNISHSDHQQTQPSGILKIFILLHHQVARPAQQAGFPKAQYSKRMRNETQEFRERDIRGQTLHQAEGAETESKPALLYFIIISAVNETITHVAFRAKKQNDH